MVPAPFDGPGGGRSYTKTFTYAPTSLNATGFTDTLGRSETDTLDARGNVTAASDGTTTTSGSYDLVDRLTSSRDPEAAVSSRRDHCHSMA